MNFNLTSLGWIKYFSRGIRKDFMGFNYSVFNNLTTAFIKTYMFYTSFGVRGLDRAKRTTSDYTTVSKCFEKGFNCTFFNSGHMRSVLVNLMWRVTENRTSSLVQSLVPAICHSAHISMFRSFSPKDRPLNQRKC